MTTPFSLLGSWIDLEDAASAARDLCPPHLLPTESAGDPSLGLESLAPGDLNLTDDYRVDSFPAPAVSPELRTRLADVRERATRSGLIGHAPAGAPEKPTDAPPDSPPLGSAERAAAVDAPAGSVSSADGTAAPIRFFVPPQGPLNLRARALGDWIRESFSPSSAFVADAHGRTLVEFDSPQGIIAAAVMLADTAVKARRHLDSPAEITGALHIQLSAESTLSLVTVGTTLGTFHAAIARPDPLSRSSARAVARALRHTIESGV